MVGKIFGDGSLDRPLVRFYFTSSCPELGLKEPVGGEGDYEEGEAEAEWDEYVDDDIVMPDYRF